MGSIVAFLIAQGWASGISTWGVLVATGVADEAGWVDAPGALGSPALLAVASVFLAIEVVADKVAYVDSVSDAIQTLIRPVAGAAIAAEWGSADEQISTELAAVIGPKPRPRSQVAKDLWAYIHKNGLQDSKVKRNINPDDALGKVFGAKKTIDMFKMTALVNKHLKK